MTLIKLNRKPFEQNFNSWMDDFFAPNASMNKEAYNKPAFKTSVPVNVVQSETGYRMEVVAPGFDKEAFKVEVEQNLLTISAEVKKVEERKEEKAVRNEYRYASFKRSFTLDENIDAENIAAEYKNGVLILNLPKKAEVKPATKNITIQ